MPSKMSACTREACASARIFAAARASAACAAVAVMQARASSNMTVRQRAIGTQLIIAQVAFDPMIRGKHTIVLDRKHAPRPVHDAAPSADADARRLPCGDRREGAARR